MLLKTPVSTPWAAAPLTRRLLGPASLLAGFFLGASAVLWDLAVEAPQGHGLPLLLVLGLALLVGFCVHVLLTRVSARFDRVSVLASARSGEPQLAADPGREVPPLRLSDGELRTAIAQHQAFLETLSGGFAILDRFDRYIHVSPGVARVLGCNTLLLGRRLLHDLPEHDAPAFYAAFAHARRFEEPTEVEFLSPKTERWVAARIEPGPCTTTVFFRDVNEQRATLERVLEAEDSFRLFTENVQDVFWVVDVPERRLIYVSPSWERLTGLPVSYFHDNPRGALDLAHRDDRERLRAHLLRCGADAQNQGSSIEFRIVRPDGETRWLHLRSFAMHDEQGGITRLSGFASDISVRKQIEANLRQSEMRFRSLSDSSPVGIFRTDRELCTIDVNKRFLEICKLPQRSLANPQLITLILPEDQARVREQWQRVEREGAWECRLASPDGAVRTVLMRVAVEYGPEGEQVGYIGTLSDLTEYREVQNRLTMTERMASLGTLAAGVGHEINNPLTYLMCNLELAQRALTTLRSDPTARNQVERVAQHLHVALEGAGRICDIVQELRVFSRSDDEQVGAVNVVDCIEAALSIASHQVRHRARVVRDVAETPLVRADETRLGQVFLNLIVNAAQAMPEGQADRNSLTIRSRFDAANRRVVVSFTDTGTGIAPELLNRIFDPFFTTKAVGEGSGLGLFLSQQMLRNYGGSIEIESEVGRGSTFHVMLALAEPSVLEVSDPVVEALESAAPRSRILVIDDEREVGLAIAAMLDAEHEIFVADRAEQALELVQAESFDLILCDLMMPSMNACEFFRALGRVAPEHRERVCFMTGGVFTDTTRSFLSEVTRPLLHKPFSLASLKGAVREALSQTQRAA